MIRLGGSKLYKRKVLEEIIEAENNDSQYLKRRIDAYEILDLINPQNKNPEVFLRFFSTMMTPILNNLKNFINEKIRKGVQEQWSEQQKID